MLKKEEKSFSRDLFYEKHIFLRITYVKIKLFIYNTTLILYTVQTQDNIIGEITQGIV